MRWAIGITAVLLTTAAQASSATLPDACGKDDVRFKVKTNKKQPVPNPPDASTAQVIFIESLQGEFSSAPTVRFASDGTWTGADRGVSYFAASITPGQHHLCASRQASSKQEKDQVGLATLNAEAGKVYFYELKVIRTELGSPTLMASGGRPGDLPTNTMKDKPTIDSVEFSLLSDEDGKNRIKSSAVSTYAVKP